MAEKIIDLMPIIERRKLISSFDIVDENNLMDTEGEIYFRVSERNWVVREPSVGQESQVSLGEFLEEIYSKKKI